MIKNISLYNDVRTDHQRLASAVVKMANLGIISLGLETVDGFFDAPIDSLYVII